MNYDHVKIGTVVSKHGYHGFIKINIVANSFDSFPKIDHLFIEIDECYIPFMIQKIKSFSGDYLIVKFLEVNSEEDSRGIVHKNVFIESERINYLDNDSLFYNELINFAVFKDSKKIGYIQNINSRLPQPVFEISYNSGNIMVPIHNDLIKKIDKSNKIIHIDFPDGLLEIT